MIGVISDIHSNFEALKVVIDYFDNHNITEIYCLGDVVGYYAQVNECCDLLKERNIPCLMGNHDWYMASGGFCPRSKSVNDCLIYQRKVISNANLKWLKSFKLQFQINNIKMVHGGWGDPIDEYIFEPKEEYFNQIEGQIFVSGHTHIQILKKFKDKIYLNPGSVGMPRDNNPRSAFAIIEGNNITLNRLEYNMEKVFYLMEKAGFDNYYYGNLINGSKNLHKL
jgi:putative phosphoesterase